MKVGFCSAPCAATAGDTSHPAKTGLLQAPEVFIDTILICGCAAFIIIDQLSWTDGFDIVHWTE